MYTNGNHQVRMELPVAIRHRRVMTGKLLKVVLKRNTHTLATQWSRMYKNGNHQAALYKFRHSLRCIDIFVIFVFKTNSTCQRL